MTDDFQQGDVLAQRYRILGTLGRGGMATVYLAEDQTLARHVAIKVLHKRFAEDEKFVERFRREAKAAAGLNHPNIVGVYDWGQLGAQNYIVMEYVEGETLKERIRRRGRINDREAIAITLELLSALAAAHAKGVVHRDVKSHNILIDSAGRVKVTDFGIAQAGDPSMTEAGSILGTAQYLAPEQARGEPVDERSDLYSVGVVLYEMLTGSVPFKGDTAVTVALRHVNEVPAAPATMVAGIPPALNQVVMKALAKDPANRYSNAAEFGRDLRAVQAGSPVAAASFDPLEERTQLVRRPAPPPESPTRVMTRRVSAAPPPQRQRRRPRWILVVIGLVVLAAVAAITAIVLASGGGGSGTAAVPSVVNLKESAAIAKLAKAGFTASTHDSFSDTVTAGRVIRQQPRAGTELAKNEPVEIWVSQGAATVTLEDFTDMLPAEVESWLSSHNLTGLRKTGKNASVDQGHVYQQKPAAGTAVKRGSTVTYWVSSGEPTVDVPYVVGKSSADAGAAIVAAGLTLGSVNEQYSDTVDPGLVISQDPGAGRAVLRGTPVSIVVSKGPSASPTPSPSPTLVSVPEVIGDPASVAESTLKAAGFKVTVTMVSQGQPSGTVIDQNPAGNTQAPYGSTVTLTVQE